jgi:hypothetical protein
MKSETFAGTPKMSTNCKPQDVLVALKLCTIGDEPWSFTRLAESLDISVGASHNAITHLRAAGLVFERRGEAVVAKKRLADFLIHGVPAVFFAVRAGIAKGMPTSTFAPMLSRLVPSERTAAGAEAVIPVVWPTPNGKVRGESLIPIYDTAPKAAQQDLALYELLALVDGVRVARGRERRACIEALHEKVTGEKSERGAAERAAVPDLVTD